jgi:hypothetical protein
VTRVTACSRRITGHLRDYLEPDPQWWPMMAPAMEFGPWVHPLNLIMSLFVFAVIPIIQFIKWARPESDVRLRIGQISMLWSFRLL